MRADLIDDLAIEASRLAREALARKVRTMKAQQQGEAFKNLEQ
jgi:hypothetical protein